MPQQAIEVILMRQLASYLAMPIFLVDPSGDLLFYNEPAEALLGHRYEETGEMPLVQWAQVTVIMSAGTGVCGCQNTAGGSQGECPGGAGALSS